MTEVKKLYRVTLKGMKYSITGISEGISYVVAENSNEAYLKVKKRLDDKDYGLSKERELETIELLASDYDHNNIGTLLYL